MYLLFVCGWLTLVAGAYCAARAHQLDGELRRLLPPVVERRWRDRESRERRLNGAFFARIEFPLGSAHRRRELHGERGAKLVDRLWLLGGVSCLLILLGGTLIAGALS